MFSLNMVSLLPSLLIKTSKQSWIFNFVEGALLEDKEVRELIILDSLQFLQIAISTSSAALERNTFVSVAFFITAGSR